MTKPTHAPKNRTAIAFWLSKADLKRMDAKAKKLTAGNRTKLLRRWIAA